MQNLNGFSVPKGFRGGGAIKVQLWWAVQATLFRLSPQVMYRWRAGGSLCSLTPGMFYMQMPQSLFVS